MSRREGVLKVPVSALFRSGEDWSVFRVDGGTAKLTKVKIGNRNTLEAEITGGLKVNDSVVVHPSDKVADGVTVAKRE